MNTGKQRLVDNYLFKFLILIVVPAAVLMFVHFRMGNYYESVFILFFVNVILTASLNLTNGITGIFSLGQAAFMALGAYISSLLTLSEDKKRAFIRGIPEWLAKAHLPFWAAMLVAAVLTTLVAALVGYVILRAKGHYLAVITLGMVIVVKYLLDNASTITNGSRGINGMVQYTTLPVVVFMAVLTLFILYRLKISAFGRSMIALRDDEDAASSLGIRSTTIRLMSFMISAFFAAVGGCLWAHLERTLAPSLFYFDETFSILEMSVLGGMATLSGSIPGAAVLTFLPHLLADYENGFVIFGLQVPKISGLSSMVMSILFILVIVFRKGGVTKDSEYIVASIFDPKTYTGLFKKETYSGFIRSLFRKTK